MRDLEYLSPTSIRLWEEDRSEFYLKYLADNRPPRMPQTQPMAVGSAFDAYIKSRLVKDLFDDVRPEFELTTIFEQQVEPQNRDWARLAGAHVYNQYVKSGALADLMIELSQATHEPRFEFTVTDDVMIKGGAVPLLGKPDVYFITKGGDHVIYDWKVNGYCGQRATSPRPGYIMCRPDGKAHKDCQTTVRGGINVNIATTLENVDKDWASQISIYGWVLGEDVGSQFIAGIDQIVCKPNGEYPIIRVASHRCSVGKQYQLDLENSIADMWHCIRNGLIFEQDNEERCRQLDEYHKAYGDESNENEKWFREITREY